jgi:micrococcal nuclease
VELLRRWQRRSVRAVAWVRASARRHPRVGVGLLAVVVLAAIGLGGSLVSGSAGGQPAAPNASPTSLPAGERRGPFPVVEVLDGETLRVQEHPGAPTTVRLLGIDAPTLASIGVQSNCLAAAATTALKTMLNGRRVDLENDPTAGPTDEDGREFAYVYLDGTLVNQDLLQRGDVNQYADGRSYRYKDRFLAAEQAARDAGLGVWSPGSCSMPPP